MNHIPDRAKGYGEIIAASVLFSFAGVFAKMIRNMPVQSIIFYRVSFAFVIFFIALSVSGSLAKIKLRDKKIYLILFGTLQAATMLTYFVSILNASVAVAVLLLYTAPAYVTLFSPLFLKERLTKQGLIALILSIAGMVLIVDPGKLYFSGYSVGVLAGVLSGIAYAFGIIVSKHISSTYSGYAQAFWSFAIAMLVLLPVGLAPADVVFRNIVYLILLAIFPSILAVSLYFNGLKKVKASSASILGLIEPLSAVILAIFILDEKISFFMLAGGALILTGAVLVTIDERYHS